MKKKWIVLIILGIILVLLFAMVLLLSLRETDNIKNLRKDVVNIAKCYSSCPIEEEESVAKPGETHYYMNLSCRIQCHEAIGNLTGRDMLNMNLSEEDSYKLLSMVDETNKCIQGYNKEEINSCLGEFIQKYS